jgi:hypothetical protein
MIRAITNSSEFIVSHFTHTASPMSSLSSADIAAADGNLSVAPVAPRAGFSGRGSQTPKRRWRKMHGRRVSSRASCKRVRQFAPECLRRTPVRSVRQFEPFCLMRTLVRRTPVL